MSKFRIFGQRSDTESDREKRNRLLAKTTAEEGIVLLKNNGILPLKTRNISLFGNGARMTVKGGSGSGDVRERYSVNIETGLLNVGFSIKGTQWLDRFDEEYNNLVNIYKQNVEEKIKGFGPFRTMKMFDIIHESSLKYPIGSLILDNEIDLTTNTCIYVISRQAGEGGDRKLDKGDFYLSDVETENIKKLSNALKHIILIINTGSIIDLSIIDEISNIDAILYINQPGMEGGNAVANILIGAATPSGKLTNTWAYNYFDYPSADTYSHVNNVVDFEHYKEGIYVGYRYFDATAVKPRFEFGYGLSYTSFSHKVSNSSVKNSIVSFNIQVKNEGDYSGKEVLQLYLSKPGKMLDVEQKILVGFVKTSELSVGKHENINIQFDFIDFMSFDTNSQTYLLEKGIYGVYLGNSSQNVELIYYLDLIENLHSDKLEYVSGFQNDFQDFSYAGKEVSNDEELPTLKIEGLKYPKRSGISINSMNVEHQIDLSSFSVKELISICVGAGYGGNNYHRTPGVAGRTTGKLLSKKIPDINLSDGPAGINILQKIVYTKHGFTRYIDELPKDWQWGWVKKLGPYLIAKPNKGTKVYQYMTAFPSETLLAQTWNEELLYNVGKAIGEEMIEVGITLWLAPGINIQRNPLCGRNFEYYSEDPHVTHKMATALTKGVQSHDGIGVTIKHYCCNNQEENRNEVNEIVSERGLREIYTKAFGLIIRDAKPWSVMTSYNKVNGSYTFESYTLITKLLRQEFGFTGLVMSDWNATDKGSHAKSLKCGSDLIMPGNNKINKSLFKAYKEGQITRNELEISATRVLNVIYKSKVGKEFIANYKS